MAPAVSPSFPSALCLLLLLCSSNGKVHGDDRGVQVVRVETLKPATVCSEWKAPSGNAVKVVHRQGPCFPSGGGGPTDDDQILRQDSPRVAYLQSRVRLAKATEKTSADALQASQVVNLPAWSGDTIGAFNYVVTVGIGTPKTEQTVDFDTGSQVCWLQCKPNYPQRQPLFNPRTSSSYRNVSCTAPACTHLPHGYGDCIDNTTCAYRIEYHDSSVSYGFLATETLALSPTDVFENFVFGCGQNITGNFRGAAGVFGLARSYHSLVTQTAARLGNAFSYCLPSVSSSPGYLIIGRRTAPSPIYTPMLLDRPEFADLYFIDLIGISVASRRLPVSPTVFQRATTIIDSGTVTSRLPTVAYSELKAAFRSGMSRYRQAPQMGILDTCYSIRRPSFTYSRITLHFAGGANVDLSAPQVFLMINTSTYCLAFAADESGIIGNTQQRGMEVIYDNSGRRFGFSRGTSCH